MPIRRRRFLGALAVAPAALAGCAAPAAASGSRRPPASGVAPGAAAEAVRAFPLPAEVEPAAIFRAAAARPGER